MEGTRKDVMVPAASIVSSEEEEEETPAEVLNLLWQNASAAQSRHNHTPIFHSCHFASSSQRRHGRAHLPAIAIAQAVQCARPDAEVLL
jgi:hypothetical protein